MNILITGFAAKRMDRNGIKVDQVEYAIKNSEESYTTHGERVHKASLPDGGTIKVRVRETEPIEIVDAIKLAGQG